MGQRDSTCNTEFNCTFGSASVGGNLAAALSAEISGSALVYGVGGCSDVTLTPIQADFSFNGQVGWNVESCSSGLDGDVTVGEIIVSASVDFPGFAGVNVSFTAFEGATF